jgi:hypothetical protein
MKPSRHALTISLFYTLPLLVWLAEQLAYIGWSDADLQSLFRQALAALLLLQAMSAMLLLINSPGNTWQYDVSGLMYVVLFPLPFLALIWLTGSTSLLNLGKGLLLVASVGTFAFLIQRCSALIPARLQSVITLTYVLLAVTLWNYRELWWEWLAL